MVDEATLRNLQSTGLSQRQIAKELHMSQSNIVYWINKYHIIYTKTSVCENICTNCGVKFSGRSKRKFCTLKCCAQYRKKINYEKMNYENISDHSAKSTLLFYRGKNVKSAELILGATNLYH